MKRRRHLRDFPSRLHPVYWMGGTPSNTTSETTTKLSPELAREIGPFADFARKQVRTPYKAYKGQLVAGFNPDQLAAFDQGRQGSGAQGQYATLLGQGPFQGTIGASENTADAYLTNLLKGGGVSAAENQAGGWLSALLGGGRITGEERVAGDYLGNLLRGGGISAAETQAGNYLSDVVGGRSITGGEKAADEFLGSFYDQRQNPFFEDQLGIGRKAIGEQYSDVIAPGLAGKYAMSGAFGGTAQSEAEGRSQRELLRGLGEYETGARSAEQERRYAQGLQAAGLTEAAAGRRQGQGLQAAGQIDATARGRIQEALAAAGLVDQTAGRRNQEGLAASGLIEQTSGRRIGQGLQASGLIENTAGRRAANSLMDAQLRGQLIGQQENAFQNDFTRLLGIGAQQQGLQQQQLDSRYEQFLRKQAYPRQTFDMYRDAIAALTGAGGGSQSQTGQTSGGGPSDAQTAAGAATTAAALYALFSAGSAASGCWVAREVFGTTDGKWLEFRQWLFVRAPRWFFDLYILHGEKFAEFLRRHSYLKPIVRWWMQRRIK